MVGILERDWGSSATVDRDALPPPVRDIAKTATSRSESSGLINSVANISILLFPRLVYEVIFKFIFFKGHFSLSLANFSFAIRILLLKIFN